MFTALNTSISFTLCGNLSVLGSSKYVQDFIFFSHSMAKAGFGLAVQILNCDNAAPTTLEM